MKCERCTKLLDKLPVMAIALMHPETKEVYKLMWTYCKDCWPQTQWGKKE